jgi:predicted RND superfamily exporter protein
MTEIERIIEESPLEWFNEGSKLTGQKYLAKAIEQYVQKREKKIIVILYSLSAIIGIFLAYFYTR